MILHTGVPIAYFLGTAQVNYVVEEIFLFMLMALAHK